MGTNANLEQFIGRLEKIRSVSGYADTMAMLKEVRLLQAMDNAMNQKDSEFFNTLYLSPDPESWDPAKLRLMLSLDGSTYSDEEIIRACLVLGLKDLVMCLAQDHYSPGELEMAIAYWESNIKQEATA